MNKKLRIIAFILVILLLVPSSALAHSGRTDSSGGHRDNKNASGLGYYHYHHGYSAHLHTNGVCPYDVPVSTPVSTQNTNTTTSTVTNSAPVVTSPSPQVANIITICIDNDIVQTTEDSGTPFIDSSNRTQVPLRLTMEKCGCTVTWDNSSKAAYVIKDETTVCVPVGKNYITINGNEQKIDTSAMIKNGRTYLPIRPVLEAFNYNVTWDQSTKKVIVSSSEGTDMQ